MSTYAPETVPVLREARLSAQSESTFARKEQERAGTKLLPESL